jgi:hypothetical protein
LGAALKRAMIKEIIKDRNVKLPAMEDRQYSILNNFSRALLKIESFTTAGSSVEFSKVFSAIWEIEYIMKNEKIDDELYRLLFTNIEEKIKPLLRNKLILGECSAADLNALASSDNSEFSTALVISLLREMPSREFERLSKSQATKDLFSLHKYAPQIFSPEIMSILEEKMSGLDAAQAPKVDEISEKLSRLSYSLRKLGYHSTRLQRLIQK